MARRLRIQYSGAIYHVMARGNGRQDIVADDSDRERLLACLERAVKRASWITYAFVFLTNHLHLVLKTPRPNLARGMQLFLSAYANSWARRHRQSGHLFQGRYRTELVEDETYLWVLTRYVHLNPVRAGLVVQPDAWPWSSCPGYFSRRARLDWIAYEELLAAWAGEFGRTDAEASYRRFVLSGVTSPPTAPWAEARHGWLLGSERFLGRVRERLTEQRPSHRDLRREERLLHGLGLGRVIEAVCRRYGVDARELGARGSRSPARAALAYLAKHHTECTRAELVPILGLSRPESVPNLSARFAALLRSQKGARQDLKALEVDLGLNKVNSKSV
jgi:REP element-mobilizing transposase RayT